MKTSPNYYAVIPAEVRYDETLSPNAKLLYGEITALASKEGFCWASNGYFASLYKVSGGTISEWVRQLNEAGHISYLIDNQNIRKIFVKPSGNPEGGIGKIGRGVSENPEDSITSNNTIKNIDFSDEKSALRLVKEDKEGKEVQPKQKKERDPAWGLYMRCVALLSQDAGFDVMTSAWDFKRVKTALKALQGEDHVMYLVEDLIATGKAYKAGYSLSKMLSASVINKYAADNL